MCGVQKQDDILFMVFLLNYRFSTNMRQISDVRRKYYCIFLESILEDDIFNLQRQFYYSVTQLLDLHNVLILICRSPLSVFRRSQSFSKIMSMLRFITKTSRSKTNEPVLLTMERLLLVLVAVLVLPYLVVSLIHLPLLVALDIDDEGFDDEFDNEMTEEDVLKYMNLM